MNDEAQMTVKWLQDQFPDLQNIEPLSKGGQKIVLSAHHPSDGEIVLKLVNPGTDTERIKRELIAAKRLSSVRVPTIFDQGIIKTPIGECVWIREQRIDGITVRQKIITGPIEAPYLLKLALDVSETLEAAESISIVHRDVKPDNLILDTTGKIWLIDFGISRHLGLESLTATASMYGQFTWGYAPLEQCQNLKKEIDARADLFALGVTLYECATGINPFREGARDALEILQRVEKGVMPRLNLTFSSATDFSDLVMALTQKQRVHRPPTAKEAHEWITEICEKEGIK